MGRKIRLIFASIGAIIIYSAFWYYASINGRDLLAKQLKIDKEEIISVGYPLRLRYKLPDHGELAKKNRINRISLDIFSKHISVELRDFDLQGGLGGNIESISRLKVRGRLESYYAAYKIYSKGGRNIIDLFNLFEKVGLNFKLTEDKTSGAYLSGDVNLSIPHKRRYSSKKDLYKDLPQKSNLVVNYRLFSNTENNKNIPAFYKKIYKMVHPENVHMSLGLKTLKHGIGIDDIIKNPVSTIKNIELTGKSRSDNPMVFSNTDFTILPDNDVHKIIVKNISQYKGESIKLFLESLLKDDYADLVIFSINRMGLIIPDSIKDKIRIFTDTMYSRLQARVESDPGYWDKLRDFKGKFTIEIDVNHEDPMEDIAYSINIHETSLNGHLTFKEKKKEAKGVLVLNDAESDFSELIIFAKFAIQAFEDGVTPEEFKQEIQKHNLQINNLHKKLINFSDDPQDRSGKVQYSFDLDSHNPFKSKISKNKSFADLISAMEEKSDVQEESEEKAADTKAPNLPQKEVSPDENIAAGQFQPSVADVEQAPEKVPVIVSEIAPEKEVKDTQVPKDNTSVVEKEAQE
jgi:hypothetical protein